jgi:hypothetical protein
VLTAADAFGRIGSAIAVQIAKTVRDHDADIICAAVREMLERIDGKVQPDTEADERRARADRIYDAKGIGGMSRPAAAFVNRYATVIA